MRTNDLPHLLFHVFLISLTLMFTLADLLLFSVCDYLAVTITQLLFSYSSSSSCTTSAFLCAVLSYCSTSSSSSSRSSALSSFSTIIPRLNIGIEQSKSVRVQAHRKPLIAINCEFAWHKLTHETNSSR